LVKLVISLRQLLNRLALHQDHLEPDVTICSLREVFLCRFQTLTLLTIFRLAARSFG